jgi:parallel beta helix pectate lyase-like protein
MKKGLMLFAVLLSTLGPFALMLAGGWAPAARASGCTPTGFVRGGINMTAALINPSNVTGEVDATGCNMGIYYGPGASGTVNGADIHGANYFGVANNGGAVNILNSLIHDIGESPFDSAQHGVGIYFVLGSGASGTISGNKVFRYQKSGIVVNGAGTSATIRDNTVTGFGAVSFTAQNGIQVGYGADASVMRNTVSGNSYTGDYYIATGILVVGGPGNGGPFPYTVGTQVVGNTLINNDVGVWISNYATETAVADVPTNIKAVNNTISNDGANNPTYQAGVSDGGNNDKIIDNTVSGLGYTTSADHPYFFPIDVDPSPGNRAKVHANK